MFPRSRALPHQICCRCLIAFLAEPALLFRPIQCELFAVADPVELWTTLRRRPSEAANSQGVAGSLRRYLRTLFRCPRDWGRPARPRIPFARRLLAATP